jgi:hypothetical protein
LWWKSIVGWRSQHIIKQYDDDVNNMNWLFLSSDDLHCVIKFFVFTGICKYQVKNKTDKYILDILEHNHLQNTVKSGEYDEKVKLLFEIKSLNIALWSYDFIILLL